MTALSVAKLIFFFAGSEMSLNKTEKKKFMESLDQFRHSGVRQKVRNVFVMSLRLTYTTSHQFSSSFFDFARICWLFSLVFPTL